MLNSPLRWAMTTNLDPSVWRAAFAYSDLDPLRRTDDLDLRAEVARLGIYEGVEK